MTQVARNAAVSTFEAFQQRSQYDNPSSVMDVDMLHQLRVITVIITLEIFFGIGPGFLHIDELIVIMNEMVAYLKVGVTCYYEVTG